MQEQQNNGKKNYTLTAVIVACSMSFFAILVIVLSVVFAGSIRNAIAKPDEEEEYEWAGSSDEDDSNELNGSLDDFDWDDAEDTDEEDEEPQTEQAGVKIGHIKFNNGEEFRLSCYGAEKVEELSSEFEIVYDLQGEYLENNDMLMTTIDDSGEKDFDEVLSSISMALETGVEGDAEIIMYEEGAYVIVKGNEDSNCAYAFVTEGENGMIYTLCWICDGGYGIRDNLNTIVSDFFASGIAGEDKKNKGVIGSFFYEVPDSFFCDFRCEYFATYYSNKYRLNVMINNDPTDDYRRFMAGEFEKSDHGYDYAKIGSYESQNYGTITIIECVSQTEENYEYFIGNDDGTVDALIFKDRHAKPVSKEDCEMVAKGFAP